MPLYFRRDDFVDAAIFGYSIPNIAVTYYVQPSLTLAPVFTGPTGGATTNPQFTDGLGHAVAYLSAGTYTIVYSGQQIQTMTLPDQVVGGAGGGGSAVTFFAGVPSGTIDGVNRVFTFAVAVNPSFLIVTLNYPLKVNVGYTVSWASGTLTIVYANAPQAASGPVPADELAVQGAYES